MAQADLKARETPFTRFAEAAIRLNSAGCPRGGGAVHEADAEYYRHITHVDRRVKLSFSVCAISGPG
jgi:hypothetical protein